MKGRAKQGIGLEVSDTAISLELGSEGWREPATTSIPSQGMEDYLVTAVIRGPPTWLA